MTTREALLAGIEAFLLRSGMTERQFGVAAVNDHKFLARLREQSVTLDRIERAEAFMVEWAPTPTQPAAQPVVAQ